ncbi:hypothetical protein [Mesonia aestuariivivens]|uniref:Uncharacterized protein n=1 Tax=Mesonia aestuariivivens TaxID=2796128 RepID=A0ABS6W7A4_9FLAO|nr:hypothetical protein [Mesonia aestuariivivens]MBW2962998.1 hypothetical protein [Mesonia aestuariivivens]
MAQQSGIIKLKGSLGGISFYKTSDGYLAREKGGVSAQRIANDPVFQRTRENNAEFATAGKAGRLLRNAIQVLLQNAKDKRCVARLTRLLLAIVKTDQLHPRGERQVEAGNFQLLNGFEFNQNAKLGTSLYVPFETSLDRSAGTLTVSLPAYQPSVRIAAPKGTSHFRLAMAGVELNFEDSSFNFSKSETPIIAHNSSLQAGSTLVSNLTENANLPIIGIIGVAYFQEVNGEMYPLKNGAFNALAVSFVDQV